ncbi:ATPase, T2SS/T4P/T4SS family [Orrella daihaiensis]|uniref:Flp pilus assembly complex ATPase component TadA n=1 Tax=Orrella daihaiensis TaxID=2782176 RepID=A0ABY4ALQ7_9BURK|nr:ATPase, T2SS/T4P/T4SS family [Orrella daihaiensis]UOD51239.1 Flp pilus assembly complex ATPase component TadA [Orrella daihaiensis]
MKRAQGTASVLMLGESLMHEAIGVMGVDTALTIDNVEPLFDRLHVPDPQLASQMCPVRLPDGTAQVWVLPEYAHHDQARALVLALAQLGMSIAKPSRQIVPPARLGELNRGLRHGKTTQAVLRVAASTPKHVLVTLLDDLITWALKADASDIHLTVRHAQPYADVAFSINGGCFRPAHFRMLSTEVVLELLAVSWMTVQGGNGAVFDVTCEQQGRFERTIGGDVVGLRWASLVIQGGVSVCWRLLNRVCWQVAPSLDELGYDPTQYAAMLRATHGHGGLVVFAGLVGSGKSTSLAALMKLIPTTRKIITLEDPVEYVIDNALQCPVAGFDAQAVTGQLASKLKTIKRSAAHDVLIGELRDTLGGQAVVDLVLAGTNVYTTVHASSALQILTRLSSDLIGVPESLLVMPGFIKLLVYQVLLKQLCTACSQSASDWLASADGLPDQPQSLLSDKLEWLERLAQVTNGNWQDWRFRNHAGCAACQRHEDSHGTGYRDRLLIAEMIEPAALPGFYPALAGRSLWQQVASWQLAAGTQASELTGYLPVVNAAQVHLNQGLIDPLDYVLRFAPVLTESV